MIHDGCVTYVPGQTCYLCPRPNDVRQQGSETSWADWRPSPYPSPARGGGDSEVAARGSSLSPQGRGKGEGDDDLDGRVRWRARAGPFRRDVLFVPAGGRYVPVVRTP